MVSIIYADRPEPGPERIRQYFVAKGVADDRLRASKLNYTIIRPGYLTNDPPKGTVRIAEHIEESGEIPRGDVARTIVEALENEHTYRRSFDWRHYALSKMMVCSGHYTRLRFSLQIKPPESPRHPIELPLGYFNHGLSGDVVGIPFWR